VTITTYHRRTVAGLDARVAITGAAGGLPSSAAAIAVCRLARCDRVPMHRQLNSTQDTARNAGSANVKGV